MRKEILGGKLRLLERFVESLIMMYPDDCLLILSRLVDIKRSVIVYPFPFLDYPYSKSLFLFDGISMLLEDFESAPKENAEEILMQIDRINKILFQNNEPKENLFRITNDITLIQTDFNQKREQFESVFGKINLN